MAGNNPPPKSRNQTLPLQTVELNPTIRGTGVVCNFFLGIVSGLTLLGQWGGLDNINPIISWVFITLSAVSWLLIFGALGLAQSTAKIKNGR